MDDTKQLYESLSTNVAAATTNNNNVQDPKLKNPQSLCETLFNQLHSKFRQFLSALPHDAEARSLPNSHSRLWPIVEDLSLILRSFMLSLTLPHSDQKFLITKCHSLLHILKAFLSVDLIQRHETTILRFHSFFSDHHIELSDSSRPFLCALLEVFADELSRHQSLRKYLMIADSASSIGEKHFVCRFNYGDIVVVLEVISAHFILSVSDENAFEDFISGLFLRCDKDVRFPQLSLAPAIALLLDPVVLSAPKMLQAHMISLVSEAIGSGSSSENLSSDMGNHLLLAFEKSVTLYSMHVSRLQMDGFHIESNCAYNSYLHERGSLTFESYIQQGTRNRLNEVLSKSDNLWNSYRCKISSKTKADLLTDYMTFIKERLYIFSDSCKDMTASILNCIIHRIFSQVDAGEVLHVKENTSTEDICLLASILKLMSVSLLQAIKFLSVGGDLGCLKTTGIASVYDKYDLLVSIISHFQQFKFCLPIQTFLYNVMKSQQTNYEVSKSMLVHFSGLLSLSFSVGPDLLAKGSISVMMALMNLFNFEDGDLVALGSLKGPPLQSCLSESPFDNSGEGVGDKQSIYKIAAEFHKIRTRSSRMDSITSCNLVEDGIEETCNGEMFLDCILEDPSKVSDYAELSDFLECKSGKNYSRWLNSRQTYRKRRYQKMVDIRKIKKETIWKSMKCQKIGKLLKRWR